MSWGMASKGIIDEVGQVPSGEIEVSLGTEALLEVSLETSEITVELNDG